jgi:predicted AlkP superfamily phosphohydrolase/phosphomutase
MPGAEAGDFFRHVDWSRTRAYAVGLGGIYLNLAGREEGGVVAPEVADDVKSAISRSLAGLVDPERGGVAVRRVVEREAVYSGPYVDEAPDLLVNFSAGYRASWGTPLGAVPATVFEDNGKKWAGDHAIDPTLVPGVLFTSRSVSAESPSLVDLAPTILSALGVPVPASMEGQSILA